MPSLLHRIFSSRYFLLANVPEGFSHLHPLLLRRWQEWDGGGILLKTISPAFVSFQHAPQPPFI